jgi:hypothetical protein
MTQSTQTISPLRQRMIDDMRMRKLSPKTQTGYIRAVKRFAGFLGHSPDKATVEDLRRFRLYLVDHGISPVPLNATITGLRFFFEVTLERADLMARMQSVRVPRTLPVIQPGRGSTPDRLGRQPQVSGGAVGGLRRRSACQRGGRPQGRRHRR